MEKSSQCKWEWSSRSSAPEVNALITRPVRWFCEGKRDFDSRQDKRERGVVGFGGGGGGGDLGRPIRVYTRGSTCFQAKFHFLVLPREKIANLKRLQRSHLDLLRHIHKMGEDIANKSVIRVYVLNTCVFSGCYY